jgi:hypothetical protein
MDGSSLNGYIRVSFEIFHHEDYEKCHLLGCNAVWLLSEPMNASYC